MPCYNEETTLKIVVDRVLDSPCTGELIIVDDGSTDETLAIARSLTDPRVRVFAQPFNLGKGSALRRGFAEATREYVIVQDADLEYDPAEFERLLAPLVRDDADVVYGSRFVGGSEHRVLYYWHSLGNRVLTTMSNMFTNLNLTDMETCYKVFRREIIQSIDIEEDRFGFEPEITAKVARRGCRIFEVGISYNGRTYAEGKKITWRDGVRAAYCMFRYSRMGSRANEQSGFADFDHADSELAQTLDDLDVATGNYADWIASMVEPYLGDRVLEVGAGHGTITERIDKPSRKTVASDLSLRAASVLTERFDHSLTVDVVHGGVSAASRGQQFTGVLFVNVLEHIEDDVAVLREVYEVLEPGGRVIVFSPAFPSLYSEFDRVIGHVRRYRRSTIATTLSRSGFNVPEVRYVNQLGAIAWWLWARKLGKVPTEQGPASLYDKVAVPIVRRVERVRRPSFGQSVLAVGVKPFQSA
jgi:2-polyprenyl-3-methyl-5-hydroxy-6-metoxy-1,4-benzoquinol methylase